MDTGQYLVEYVRRIHGERIRVPENKGRNPLDYWLNYWLNRMKRRGHANAYARGADTEDKRIVENCVLQEWADSASQEFGMRITEPRLNQNDPPDGKALVDGREISVELTELVDGGIIRDIQAARKQGIHASSSQGELFSRAR